MPFHQCWNEDRQRNQMIPSQASKQEVSSWVYLGEHMSSTASQNTIHITHGFLWYRDVAKINRLEKTRLSGQHRREAHTAGGRHNLSHTTMDSIGMENNIH